MFAKSLAFASILSTTFAGTLPVLHTRSTLPDVTIKALPVACASYPGYNADSQTAGPWSMTVSDSENPDLLNFGPSNTYSLAIDSPGRPVMRQGYVNLGYRSGIARNAFQCMNNKLNILADTSVNSAGVPGNAKWTPTALSPYPYDASLLYLVDGEQPTLYEHYIGEEKQDGWFLGGFNTTTWGVKWYEPTFESYFYPYFYMRLLPEGQGLQPNETRIFLKIQV